MSMQMGIVTQHKIYAAMLAVSYIEQNISIKAPQAMFWAPGEIQPQALLWAFGQNGLFGQYN